MSISNHDTSKWAETSPQSLLRGEQPSSMRRDSTPVVEIGVTRYFGNIDLNRAGLLSGWAQPEEAHNWSDGCQAVHTVFIIDPGQGCVIEVEGEPFFGERSGRQDIILHVNGFQISRWRLANSGPCVLSAMIEPEQLFRRDGSMFLRCAWSFPDSISPAALGMSDDTRELGFCFRSITISKA